MHKGYRGTETHVSFSKTKIPSLEKCCNWQYVYSSDMGGEGKGYNMIERETRGFWLPQPSNTASDANVNCAIYSTINKYAEILCFEVFMVS